MIRPHCLARHIGPYDRVDPTEVIAEDDGTFLVYRSPDSAEHSADYELIAACDTREEAEAVLQSCDEGPDDGDRPVGLIGWLELCVTRIAAKALR